MLFNQPRAINFMKDCNLDGLVATSPVNVTYFTDYYFWLDSAFKEYMMNPGGSTNHPQSFAVFPISGKPALIVGAQSATNAADSWVDDLHVYGDPGFDDSIPPRPQTALEERFINLLRNKPFHANATQALVSVLKSRGLEDARIGMELEGLPSVIRQGLEQALPQALMKDATNLIRLVRIVKTEEEVRRLRRSAEINEQAAMDSLTLALPGKPVGELIQHFRSRCAELGADFEHYAYSIGGMGMSTEPNHLLTANEVLLIDTGCIHAHYFSDTGTTLAMGNLSQDLRDRYQALKDCIRDAAEIMRPGVKSSVIQAAMQAHLKKHGIAVSFPHGHGLGLEIRDYPIIVPENGLRIRDDCIDVSSDLAIEEGMVNNLEANLFMPTVGSLHVERSYLVTSNGCLPLIEQDRSQPRGPYDVPPSP